MSNGMGFGADDAQDGSYGGDYGGDSGDGGFTQAMKDAWNSFTQGYGKKGFGLLGNPPAGWQHGGWSAPFDAPHPGTGAMPGSGPYGAGAPNFGNVEGVPTGAYGPGPLDPMSAWGGPAWGPGVGQPAPGQGIYGGPITATGTPWGGPPGTNFGWGTNNNSGNQGGEV